MMKIRIHWLDKGKWEVDLNTTNHVIPIGHIEINAGGRFLPTKSRGGWLKTGATLVDAARALATEEVGMGIASNILAEILDEERS